MKIFMSAEAEINHEEFKNIKKVENQIQNLLSKNDYGDAVSELAIIPTIFSPKTYKALPYKERKRYSPKTKIGEFRLQIDYQKFKDADDDGKQKLIVQNIIDSVRILKIKVKKGFDGDKLENDILTLFEMEY